MTRFKSAFAVASGFAVSSRSTDAARAGTAKQDIRPTGLAASGSRRAQVTQAANKAA